MGRESDTSTWCALGNAKIAHLVRTSLMRGDEEDVALSKLHVTDHTRVEGMAGSLLLYHYNPTRGRASSGGAKRYDGSVLVSTTEAACPQGHKLRLDV